MSAICPHGRILPCTPAWNRSLLLSFLILMTGIFLLGGAALAGTTKKTIKKAVKIDFPQPSIITPNVVFWVKIFRKYDHSKGVIHDMDNPRIIYDIIALDPSGTSKARKKNTVLKENAVEKYQALLIGLSRKKTELSKKEKRISMLFGPKVKEADFIKASGNVRCQTGLRDKFREGVIRSGRYLDEFKRIFKSHGLPEDLVYLAHVESGFQVGAYSKVGAAGIWQFTRSTGELFMKINTVVDERRDPYIAADAAARLLKKNYKGLGEWPLAITAYNHGFGGMTRAKKKWGTYEKVVTSYRNSNFQFASKNFYPEFLAARVIAKNSEIFFGKLKYQPPASFKTIKLKGELPVKKLSGILGLSFPKIRDLNPSLQPSVFSGEENIPKAFLLKLPEKTVLKKLSKQFAFSYKTRQHTGLSHKVQKGDIAGSIARRYSVSLEDLIASNSLNPKATIYIGQILKIPAKGEAQVAVKEPAGAKKPSPSKTKPMVKNIKK